MANFNRNVEDSGGSRGGAGGPGSPLSLGEKRRNDRRKKSQQGK